MHGDNVKSIYCHWDGYLGFNGQVLQEFYDSAKANQLVALGDMSSLRADIGEKHPFSPHDLPEEMRNMTLGEYNAKFENMCTFYGRDRGEVCVEHKVAHTFAEFLEQCERSGAEYYYVMENSQWYFGSMHERDPFYKRLVLLSEALEAESVEA
jgi:hypothetical protein